MRIALALLALFIATACGSTDSATADEVERLRVDVADLQDKLTQNQADIAALSVVKASTKTGSDWPADYQKTWVDICSVLTQDAASADSEASSAKEICGCSLKGLMSAFSLKDYESWPQRLKDSAAAPYVAMCWSK